MKRLPVLVVFILSLLPGEAEAQVDTLYIYTVDTTRVYNLGQVEVGDGRTSRGAQDIRRLGIQQIERQDAAVLADLGFLLPSATVQTNSRGETLLYLRAAGERQVAYFFDGALLNIPWDNRIDLSLVPATAIGGMTVSAGVPSVLYGTNVLGGAVNFTTRTLATPGRMSDLWIQGGTHKTGSVTGTHLGRSARWNYLISANAQSRDGVSLPGSQRGLLRFQDPDGPRTGSDHKMASITGRAEYALDNGDRISVAVLHRSGEKGVAPEGHVQDTSSVRFWRYPVVQNTMMILGAENTLPLNWKVRSSIWLSDARQQIDAFGSALYRDVTDTDTGNDKTFGSRFVLFRSDGTRQIRAAINALTSKHSQNNDGQVFRQHIFSLGLEWENQFRSRWSVSAGGSWDAVRLPETGDKPSVDGFSDYGLTGGISYELTERQSLSFRAGRKTRFPTMRELFDVALNRFLENPDLKPESSNTAEVTFLHLGTSVSGESSVFYRRTFDTIDQRTVSVDGVNKRQRINLPGSVAAGIELAAAAKIAPIVTLDGHFSLMDIYGLNPDDEESRLPLAEKPYMTGAFSLTANRATGILLQMQVGLTGKAYSFDESNTPVRLAPSAAVNARVAYRRFYPGTFMEVFLRGSNLFDATILPQLGLPGPGRTIVAGVKLSFS